MVSAKQHDVDFNAHYGAESGYKTILHLALEEDDGLPYLEELILVRLGCYMIGYERGKFVLKLPPFWIMNEELQERENSKHQMKTKTFLFLFDFEFPALEVPRS